MSARLAPSPLTPEDWKIWTRTWRSGQDVRRMYNYLRADRRDADLMLGFIRLPQLEPSLLGFRPLARMAMHVHFDVSPL